jgi:hypothetical protein
MTTQAPPPHTGVPGHVYLLKPTNCTSREECFKAMAEQLFTLMGEREIQKAVAQHIQETWG